MDTSYFVDYMKKDEVTTRIHITNVFNISIENFTDNIIDRAFGIKEIITVDDLIELYKSRIFPESRGNCKDILKAMNLQCYEPSSIIKITKGFSHEDYYWLRFPKDKDLKYEDVRKIFAM